MAIQRSAELAVIGLTALLFLGISVSGFAAETQPKPTAGLAFGMLLTAQPTDPANRVPHAARSATITYISENAHGERITVSGMVYVPAGTPPAAGWPIVSWAHGTTGIADACAPSADFVGGPAHDYLSLVTPLFDDWLSHGFAVAATDYEGLGTPGLHPYMNRKSDANTVEDIVTAARQWDHGIGPRWVSIGHSQGGAAALATATQASRGVPKLKLVAAIAMAPGGLGLSQTMDFIKANPDNRGALAFMPLILLGAQAADPTLDIASVLTPAGFDFVNLARTQCVAALRSAAMSINGAPLRADADIEPLKRYLQSQDPSNERPAVPVMVVQGDNDVLAPPVATDKIVSMICAAKTAPVDYRRYPGVDHRGVLQAAKLDIDSYLVSVLQKGESPMNTCAK